MPICSSDGEAVFHHAWMGLEGIVCEAEATRPIAPAARRIRSR